MLSRWLQLLRYARPWIVAVSLGCLTSGPASGAVVATLGNPEPGFADGDVPALFDIIAAVSGQPAPFNDGIGGDPFANFIAVWTFDYAPPQESIGSASIAIGIVDHDSASPGSQVAAFSLDGIDLTAALDTALEASGGASGEYNLYTLALPASVFGQLIDGTASFELRLSGPVLTPPLFGGDPIEEPFNGATLISSQLSIVPVPEPGTFALLAAGLLGALALARRRMR